MAGPSSKPGLTVKHVNQGAGASNAHAGFNDINHNQDDLRPPTKKPAAGSSTASGSQDLKGKGVASTSTAAGASRRVPLASSSRTGIPTSSRTTVPGRVPVSRANSASSMDPQIKTGTAAARAIPVSGSVANASTTRRVGADASGPAAAAARLKRTTVKTESKVTVKTEEIVVPAAATTAAAAVEGPRRAVKRVASGTFERAEDSNAITSKRSRVTDETTVTVEENPFEVVVARTPPPAKDAGWRDLDMDDLEDPLMVSEYVNEIFNYMKALEVSYMSMPPFNRSSRRVDRPDP